VRFLIEFLRMRESLVGPFALAHVPALVAVSAGALLLVKNSTREMDRSPGSMA
jgi:hypothetical protein